MSLRTIEKIVEQGKVVKSGRGIESKTVFLRKMIFRKT